MQEAATILTEEEINEAFRIASNEEREADAEAKQFKPNSENGNTERSAGVEAAAQGTDIGDNRISISKSVSNDQIARNGGGGGAANSFKLAIFFGTKPATFDTQQLVDISNGTNPTRFTDKDFESLARTQGARATHAGRTTLKRAAIAHTFVRAQGAGRERLLELVSKLSLQRLDNTQLKEIFYSLGSKSNNII